MAEEDTTPPNPPDLTESNTSGPDCADNDDVIALYIAQANTIEQVARLSGLTRTTIYAKLKQRTFRQRVHFFRVQILSEGVTYLNREFLESCRALVELRSDVDARIKLLAAEKLVTSCLKAIPFLAELQMADMQDEINELRALIQKK